MSAVTALRSNVTAPGQAKAFGGSRRDPLAVVTNNAGQLPKKAKKVSREGNTHTEAAPLA
jgi:hypothetical protein